MRRYLVPSKVVLMSALALAACGGDDDNDDATTQDYVTGVSATVDVPEARVGAFRRMQDGKFVKPSTASRLAAVLTPPVQVTAVYHNGNPPAAGNIESAGQLQSNPLQGEPFRYAVAADGSFNQVYLQIDGVDGYWQLTLPTLVDQLELVVTLANTPPATDFTVRTLLGLPGGISQPITLQVQPGDLSDGDVVAVVRWTGGPSDLDLHMLDGAGNHVFWGNPVTADGGQLDLDSNPACVTDNVNQEIISWPAGDAPQGEYTLWTQYYDACGVTQTNFTVTLNVKGHAEQTFQGSFTGPGDDTMTDPADADTLAHFTFP